MNEFGRKPKNADLGRIGLGKAGDVFWNLEPAELVEQAIMNGQAAKRPIISIIGNGVRPPAAEVPGDGPSAANRP